MARYANTSYTKTSYTNTSWNPLVSVLLVGAALSGAPAWCPAPLHADDETDRALFEELDDGLFDGLVPADDSHALDARETAKQGSAGDAPPNPQRSEDSGSLDQLLTDELLGGEDLGMESEQTDPFTRIGTVMDSAGERLARGETSASTLRLQQQALAQLSELIELAQKNCKSSGGEDAGNPGLGQDGASQGNASDSESENPRARDSQPRNQGTQPAAVSAEEQQALIKEIWGQLPEKVRDRLPNPAGEKFLPKYERIIEEYFKRLAEAPSVSP